MSRMTAVIAGALLLAASSTAAAQERFSVELRPEAAFPVDDLGAVSLATGVGFEALLAYRIMPHIAVYGGWDWHRFATEAFSEVDVEETGYAFGLRFQHPIGGSDRIALKLRAGGTYNHLELEDSEGDQITDSGHGLGWEAGAGLAIGMGSGWEVSPRIRFRSLTREFPDGSLEPRSATLRYVGLGVGFARAF